MKAAIVFSTAQVIAWSGALVCRFSRPVDLNSTASDSPPLISDSTSASMVKSCSANGLSSRSGRLFTGLPMALSVCRSRLSNR